MPSASEILTRTPTYVWFLLAYLVWQGVQALTPRALPIWRMLVMPVIFSLIGLWPLIAGPIAGRAPLLAWLGAILIFLPLGLSSGPKLQARRPDGKVLRAGSKVPLILNMTVFCLNYALAVATVVRVDLRETLLLAGFVLSGLSLGYFSGWTFCLWRQLRKPQGAAGGA